MARQARQQGHSALNIPRPLTGERALLISATRDQILTLQQLLHEGKLGSRLMRCPRRAQPGLNMHVAIMHLRSMLRNSYAGMYGLYMVSFLIACMFVIYKYTPPGEEMLLPADAEPDQEGVAEEAPCSHPELQGAAEGLAQDAQLGAQASERNTIVHQVSILLTHKYVQAHGVSTEDIIEVFKRKSPATCNQ